MRQFQDELKEQDLFRDIDEHFLRHYPWLMPESPHYSGKHEGGSAAVSGRDPSSGRMPNEIGRCAHGKSEWTDEEDLWGNIDVNCRTLFPWLGPEMPLCSAKHEECQDCASKRDQTTGQSSESGPGLIHVRDYDRHQDGKIVHVSDYDRRHTLSEHQGEHSRAQDYDANYEQGRKDAYRRLLTLKDPFELWRDQEFLQSHPGYKQGVYDAVREMRQDPMYQKGFQDAGNGTVDPNNKMPYYLLGARENMFGDGVGLEADPITAFDVLPSGGIRRLGALRQILKDPRKIAELAKEIAKRKALERARGTVVNWKKGDPIFDKTTKGNDPNWSTIHRRYWINESLKPGATKKWTQEQLSQMRRGRAPEKINEKTGLREKMHLHHPEGREGKNFENFEETLGIRAL